MIRSSVKELLWILIALIGAFLIAYFFLNLIMGSLTLDIHLHDTYYVLPIWMGLFPMLFLLLTFFIFLVKERRRRYSNRTGNIIILCSGLAFILSGYVFMKFLNPLSGITIYPPLSGLGDTSEWESVLPYYDRLISVLDIFRFVVIIALLLFSFQWGKATNYKTQ